MKKSALALMVLALAAPAGAATITLNGYNSVGLTYWYNGTANSGAGAFNAKVSGIAGLQETWFDAYCVDLTHTINTVGTYNVNLGDMADWNLAGPAGNLRGEMASYLYNTFYADAYGNNVKRAGLQLAIWEVLFDTGADLGSGAFHYGSGSDAALAAGQSYLSALGSHLDSGNWLQITSLDLRTNQQDLIGPPVTSQVPEPASMLLLGSGLLGLAFAARRRNYR